jgi:hypothetical protein
MGQARLFFRTSPSPAVDPARPPVPYRLLGEEKGDAAIAEDFFRPFPTAVTDENRRFRSNSDFFRFTSHLNHSKRFGK